MSYIPNKGPFWNTLNVPWGSLEPTLEKESLSALGGIGMQHVHLARSDTELIRSDGFSSCFFLLLLQGNVLMLSSLSLNLVLHIVIHKNPYAARNEA